MVDDPFDYDEEFNYFDHLWTPDEHDGWTWVQTMSLAPETYSLFDAHGELMGDVYQRGNRVICWAPRSPGPRKPTEAKRMSANTDSTTRGSAGAISRRSVRRSATGCGANKKTASTSPCCGTRTRTTSRPATDTTR